MASDYHANFRARPRLRASLSTARTTSKASVSAKRVPRPNPGKRSTNLALSGPVARPPCQNLSRKIVRKKSHAALNFASILLGLHAVERLVTSFIRLRAIRLRAIRLRAIRLRAIRLRAVRLRASRFPNGARGSCPTREHDTRLASQRQSERSWGIVFAFSVTGGRALLPIIATELVQMSCCVAAPSPLPRQEVPALRGNPAALDMYTD